MSISNAVREDHWGERAPPPPARLAYPATWALLPAAGVDSSFDIGSCVRVIIGTALETPLIRYTNESWVQALPRTTAGLRDLKDGWMGEGTKAPRPSALYQVAAASGALQQAREPAIEVDPSDGEVSLIWSDSSAASLTLTFLGDGKAVLVETNPAKPLSQPVSHFSFRSYQDAAELYERLKASALSPIVFDAA